MTERAMSKHNSNESCNSRRGVPIPLPIPSRDNKLQAWASVFRELVVLHNIFVNTYWFKPGGGI